MQNILYFVLKAFKVLSNCVSALVLSLLLLKVSMKVLCNQAIQMLEHYMVYLLTSTMLYLYRIRWGNEIVYVFNLFNKAVI